MQSAEEIGNLFLTARDARPVYVRDVARIDLATQPAEHRVAHIRKQDGALTLAPAVSLAIAKRPGTNAVVISDEIVSRLEAIRGDLFPEGVDMEITRNYGETANEKANELLFHLGLATVSIVVLIALAIGWREALVTLVVIPTTILLTLFAAYLMGYTINRVSLFALIFPSASWWTTPSWLSRTSPGTGAWRMIAAGRKPRWRRWRKSATRPSSQR